VRDALKDHSRIDTTAEDDHVELIAQAACDHIEERTGYALFTQTRILYASRFPVSREAIILPGAPLSSVSSITYTDTDGDTQTFAAASYDALTSFHPGRVRPKYDYLWPTSERIDEESIAITYVCGYGNAWSDLPIDLRLAVVQLASAWYEHREAVISGTIVAEVPMHVQRVMSKYDLRAGG
jgi:uncharacterized phiE125 gp8 family phage protein